MPAATTTATSSPAAAPTTTSTTADVPGPTGPGFIPGQVTAVGDSVMLDYQDPLKASIPGIQVDAAVSRQWADGEAILQTMKAQGQLGGLVIVALGTNGPIMDADFDHMVGILGHVTGGFVDVHVDRPWAGTQQRGPRQRCGPVPPRRGRRLGHAGGEEPAVVRRRRRAPRHRRPRQAVVLAGLISTTLANG